MYLCQVNENLQKYTGTLKIFQHDYAAKENLYISDIELVKNPNPSLFFNV